MEAAVHEQQLLILLRFLTAGPSAARRVLDQTMVAAAEQASPRRPRPEDDWAWLVALALAQLRPRVAIGGPPSLEAHSIAVTPDFGALRSALNQLGPASSPFAEGPTDSTLLVLVRSLPREVRAPLALGVLYRIPDPVAREVLGARAGELQELREQALRLIHELLRSYAERQLRRAALSAKLPPRLVPLPIRIDGVAVVNGARVYIDKGAPTGIVGALLALLARLQERLKDALHLHDLSDDDVGETHNHQPLDPTPTTQPLKRPRATPSLEPHRMPSPTRGTAVHRQSPGGTPSTQRLSTSPRSLRPR